MSQLNTPFTLEHTPQGSSQGVIKGGGLLQSNQPESLSAPTPEPTHTPQGSSLGVIKAKPVEVFEESTEVNEVSTQVEVVKPVVLVTEEESDQPDISLLESTLTSVDGAAEPSTQTLENKTNGQ